MEPAGNSAPEVPEGDLYRTIRAMLPDDGDSNANCCSKGMLRWTLNKKVEKNPINRLSLVWVLIKELEKAERLDSRKCILPLLHTLMDAIIQAAYIPDELYKRVYDFCKKLLTYPQPYCSVGLSYTRQIKTERLVPGLLYQRMVTAEQMLKSEHYPFQERVFVFADPEVFSGSLIPALFGETSPGLDACDHMCNIVQHTIQASLSSEECHGPKLAHLLRDTGQDLESYFQQVQAALEKTAEEGGKGEGGALKTQMQQLYRNIFSSVNSEPFCGGPLSDCPLPNPEISFFLWTEDLDIWREVTKWFRPSSTTEYFPSFFPDLDDVDADARFSVLSSDSGIEKDLPSESDSSSLYSQDINDQGYSIDQNKGEEDTRRLSRRPGFKMRSSPADRVRLIQGTLEGPTVLVEGAGSEGKCSTRQRRSGASTLQNPLLKQQKSFTAKIVVMGDDRVVGRLAKAYYVLKKREARRLSLTAKVNLQFYYIPVCAAPCQNSVKGNHTESKGDSCTLGSYLSNADPWYKCNIKSLNDTLHKLAKVQPMSPANTKDPIISDAISYYVRCGQQPVYFNIYIVKISFSRPEKERVEDVFVSHLEVEFPEFKKLASSVKDRRRKSLSESCGAVISMNYKAVTLSGRDVDRGLSVSTMGAQISAIPSNEAEDLNCLTLTLDRAPGKSKGSALDSSFRTNNIKIRMLEARPFTVLLDRDARRCYTDVQSIEVSPCLDPEFCAHRSTISKQDKDAGLSKYLTKELPLPINTFAGIIN